MMNTILTSRNAQPNTAVLGRLAERWREAGLFLACIDRDGHLLWHDSQMPRLLGLCFTSNSGIGQQVRKVSDTASGPVTIEAPLPGLKLALIPMSRRRKVSPWIAIIARTEKFAAGSEEVAHFAQRASLDAQTIHTLSQKIPLVAPGMFASLAGLVDQMHEDLHSTATTSKELSGVTEQLTSVYEEISLLYKISSGMRFSQKPQTFLESVCREVQEIGNYRAVGVALVNGEDEAASPTLGDIAVLVGQCPFSGNDLLRRCTSRSMMRSQAVKRRCIMIFRRNATGRIFARR